MERGCTLARSVQNKSEPQSQLSKSAYSSVGHTQTNMCLWHSDCCKRQQGNVEWWSHVIMDLCGLTNYKLLPPIYNLVGPRLTSLCSANEFSSNRSIVASSWVNALHLCRGISLLPVRWARPSHLLILCSQSELARPSQQNRSRWHHSTRLALQRETGTDWSYWFVPIICQN